MGGLNEENFHFFRKAEAFALAQAAGRTFPRCDERFLLRSAPPAPESTLPNRAVIGAGEEHLSVHRSLVRPTERNEDRSYRPFRRAGLYPAARKRIAFPYGFGGDLRAETEVAEGPHLTFVTRASC